MIRLSKITIYDFKNVEYGQIDLAALEDGPSILGLYGQNGSGKTSLIEALDLLKYLLSGRSLPASFGDAIHVESPFARVVYELSLSEKEEEEKKDFGKLRYDVSFRIKGESSSRDQLSSIEVFSEVLSLLPLQGKQNVLIDTSSNNKPFGPARKVSLLFSSDKGLRTDLEYRMQFARWTGRSSIFCDDFQRILAEKGAREGEGAVLVRMIRMAAEFGKNGLYIISHSDIGEISLADGMQVPIDGSVTIPASREQELERILHHMDLVLKEIIPGLVIDYRVLSRQLLENGENGVTIQLVSEKNEKAIPLQYESEGIKKIISVLHLLIRVYNQESVTVAIDELDSGIFEYLLGELLRILSEKGRGQLIFTSHNLRPLETINREYVAFTTTNPKERYLRMSGLRSGSNLRDFYYRDLQLGGQRESLYDSTNNYDIALAFRMAGEDPNA